MASIIGAIPPDIPDIPLGLKSIRPYVKVGIELSRRDPVVAYHCFSYAMQMGLKSDYKTNPDLKNYLMKLMGFVEHVNTCLKSSPDHKDDITDDLSGHMLVESTATKLFNWADSQDRSSVFNKHVVKSFYTSSILFDILEIFKDGISEECMTQRKYARWKATYIHNCLKNNETPIPGPLGGDDENVEEDIQPSTSTNTNSTNYLEYNEPAVSNTYEPSTSAYSQPAVSSHVPPPKPVEPTPAQEESPSSSETPAALSYTDMQEAQKLCKYAGSALQYDDTASAVDYLEKCLRILKTGHS